MPRSTGKPGGLPGCANRILRPSCRQFERPLGDRQNALKGKKGKWSGCRDLNPGPPAPQAGALARLRYIPIENDSSARFTKRDGAPRSSGGSSNVRPASAVRILRDAEAGKLLLPRTQHVGLHLGDVAHLDSLEERSPGGGSLGHLSVQAGGCVPESKYSIGGTKVRRHRST
jgi:hypothetical protein